MLSPSYIILRNQRLEGKHCSSRWGGSLCCLQIQLFSSLTLKRVKQSRCFFWRLPQLSNFEFPDFSLTSQALFNFPLTNHKILWHFPDMEKNHFLDVFSLTMATLWKQFDLGSHTARNSQEQPGLDDSCIWTTDRFNYYPKLVSFTIP